MSTGMFYAPYVPITKSSSHYEVLKTIKDVDGTWFSIKIYSEHTADWILEQPQGWRYMARDLTQPNWHDFSLFDIREDVYTWFVMRWS